MSGGNVLIVDDEAHIVELIKYNLEGIGYGTYAAYDGREALRIAREKHVDLIILDLMLPEMDGLEVCRALKRSEDTDRIPIIMLTAKGEEFDRILGLELGADDYITKPFSVRELSARVKAVLRRSSSGPQDAGILSSGPFVVDDGRHLIIKDGKKLDLTVKEFELLEYLIKNSGKVLTRETLLDRIWGYEYYGGTRTVDVHIRHLRQKLEDDDSNPKYIETVRGVGYRFNDSAE